MVVVGEGGEGWGVVVLRAERGPKTSLQPNDSKVIVFGLHSGK